MDEINLISCYLTLNNDVGTFEEKLAKIEYAQTQIFVNNIVAGDLTLELWNGECGVPDQEAGELRRWQLKPA